MRKISISLIAINMLQLLAGIIIWSWVGIARLDEVNHTLYLVVSLMLVCNVVTIIGLYLAMKYKNSDMEESLHNLEKLNVTLRAQRHDYLNHFQVIYGLMELSEYEEAKKYLFPVFKDIMKVSKALKTSQPAVNALLQVKMEAAERAGIDFYPEIRSELKALPMEAWNLCKILSNLIDNSIFALSESGREEKKIFLTISEDRDWYSFRVSNNGPAIPKELQKNIFKMGVTTKKEEGHGMGLFIIDRLVREAEGEIFLSSEEENTCFLIKLPKKSREAEEKRLQKTNV